LSEPSTAEEGATFGSDSGSAIRQFLLQVLLTLLVAWAVAAYPLYLYCTREQVIGAAMGCAIVLVNALAGCMSVVWAFDRKQTDFLKVLFGGMAIRLMAMALAFGLLLAFTEVDRVGLTVSLFVFYVLFQVLEIRFLLGHLKHRGVPSPAVQDLSTPEKP